MPIIYPPAAGFTKYLPSTRMLDGAFLCEFQSVQSMVNSSVPAFGEGTLWRAGDFSYLEAPQLAADHHLTTASGVKLYVQPINGFGAEFPQFALEAFNPALDGVTDDAEVLTLALEAIQSAGGGSLIWSGTAYVGSTLSTDGWLGDFALLGRGNTAGLKTSIDDISVIGGTPGEALNITIRNLQITGAWEDNNMQSEQDRWLLHIPSAGDVEIQDCRIGSSQKGAVKFGNARSFRMIGTTIHECARGGVNISGTQQTRFEGNVFEHLGDDAISLHTTESATSVSREHIVQGNHFVDCQGINALGVRNLLVSKNTGERIRTHFVRSGYDSSFEEGNGTVLGLSVTGNVINDCLNVRMINNDGDNNYWIHVNNAAPSGGPDLPANPGEPDPSGGIVPLAGNVFGIGADAPKAGAWGLNISDNQFLRTRQAVANYSDWGEGLLFDDTGYHDPAVTELSLMPYVRFYSGTRTLSWSNNILMGFRGFRFFFRASSDAGFRQCKISDSHFIWSGGGSIFDLGGSGGNRILDVQFRNLVLDGDRFYANAAHANDGSWSSESAMTAFNLPGCLGYSIAGCHVMNVSRIENSGGALRWSAEANYQYGQCVSDGFSTENRGIGVPMPASENWQLIDCDADTGSATWGQVRSVPQSMPSVPTGGYWLKGMFVRNSSGTAMSPDGSGRLLTGWRRAITGNGNVSGTDWLPIYAATTPA